MPSKISLMTPVLQADLDDTAALEVTNKLGQTRKSTIAQLRTAIVAGVLAAAHLTSPVIDSGGLTITSGTLAAQAVTATALTVTPGATSVQALTAAATTVTTLAGTGAVTGFTSYGGVAMSSGAVSGVTTLAGTGAVSGFTSAAFSAGVTALNFDLSAGGSFGTARLYRTVADGLVVAGVAGTNQDMALIDSAGVLGVYVKGTGVYIGGGGSRVFGGAGTLTVGGAIRNDGIATGWAMGAVAGVQRISWDGTAFNFVNAGNASAPIIGSGATFNGLGAGGGVVSVGAADSGGAGFRLLRVPN